MLPAHLHEAILLTGKRPCGTRPAGCFRRSCRHRQGRHAWSILPIPPAPAVLDQRVIDVGAIYLVRSAPRIRAREVPYADACSTWRCAMLAVRLVRLIENHSEQLSRDLSEKVWNSPRCSDLHKVPPDELKARTHEIYRNLSEWLLNKTEAELEQ